VTDVGLTGGVPIGKEFPATMVLEEGIGLKLPKTRLELGAFKPVLRIEEGPRELAMTSLLAEPVVTARTFVGERQIARTGFERRRLGVDIEEFKFGLGEELGFRRVGRRKFDIFRPRLTEEDILGIKRFFPKARLRPTEEVVMMEGFLPRIKGIGRRVKITPVEDISRFRVIPKRKRRTPFQIQETIQDTTSTIVSQAQAAFPMMKQQPSIFAGLGLFEKTEVTTVPSLTQLERGRVGVGLITPTVQIDRERERVGVQIKVGQVLGTPTRERF
jgi:hypothetical protein